MTEQRKHLRLPTESRTFIELLSPLMGKSDSGRLVTCTCINISRGGLQVVMAEQVTVGAILQIGIELPGAAKPLYLAGEVRWCRANEDDRENPWAAGFELLNAEHSDIEQWIELIKRMEAS